MNERHVILDQNLTFIKEPTAEPAPDQIAKPAEPSAKPAEPTAKAPPTNNFKPPPRRAKPTTAPTTAPTAITPLEDAILKKNVQDIIKLLQNGADYKTVNQFTGYSPLMLAMQQEIPIEIFKQHGAYEVGAVFTYEELIAKEYGLEHVETLTINLSGVVSKWRIKSESNNDAIRKKFGEGNEIILKTPVFRPTVVKYQNVQLENTRQEMIALQNNEFQNVSLMKDNTQTTHRAKLLACTVKEGNDEIPFVVYEYLPGKDGDKYFLELGSLHAIQPPLVDTGHLFALIFKNLLDTFTSVHLKDKFLHLDIACRNVMINAGKVMAIDFGASLPMNDLGKPVNDPGFDRISGNSNAEAFGGKQGVRDIFTDLYQTRLMLIEALFIYINKLEVMRIKINAFHAENKTFDTHEKKVKYNQGKIEKLIELLEANLKEVKDQRKEYVNEILNQFKPYIMTLPQKNETNKAIDYVRDDYDKFISVCPQSVLDISPKLSMTDPFDNKALMINILRKNKEIYLTKCTPGKDNQTGQFDELMKLVEAATNNNEAITIINDKFNQLFDLFVKSFGSHKTDVIDYIKRINTTGDINHYPRLLALSLKEIYEKCNVLASNKINNIDTIHDYDKLPGKEVVQEKIQQEVTPPRYDGSNH